MGKTKPNRKVRVETHEKNNGREIKTDLAPGLGQVTGPPRRATQQRGAGRKEMKKGRGAQRSGQSAQGGETKGRGLRVAGGSAERQSARGRGAPAGRGGSDGR
jgi:hypothetical protein